MAADISTRAVASGGLCSATVLLLHGEEDDEPVHGLGHKWASLGGEGKIIGPEMAQVREGFIFFQKLFLICFQTRCSFENYLMIQISENI
jgi:hypothetical protein